MVQQGTLLRVSDNSGAVLVQCIRLFKNSLRKNARSGSLVLVSIKAFYSYSDEIIMLKKKIKFLKGMVFRAYVIRTRYSYCRSISMYMKFDENSILLLNKNSAPAGTKIYGPIM